MAIIFWFNNEMKLVNTWLIPIISLGLLLIGCSKLENNNNPPIINSPIDVLALVNAPFTYVAAVEDNDSDSLNVYFLDLPEWLTANDNVITGTPLLTGLQKFSLIAEDDHGNVSTAMIKITINSGSALQLSIINSVNLDSLINHVEILSGNARINFWASHGYINSRNKFSSGNHISALWIMHKLKTYGLMTGQHNFSTTGTNVYAIKPGYEFPDSIYILSAHYDSWLSGRISPGAEDNASGVAAVLEAARILSRYTTKYTLLFAFWDESEPYNLGSQAFAQHLVNCSEHIAGVIDIDMIGVDRDLDNSMYIYSKSGSVSNALVSRVQSVNEQYSLQLNPLITNAVFESDADSFWSHDFKAIGITENYSHEDFTEIELYLHSSNDKINHFDLDYFHRMSQLAIAVLAQESGVISDAVYYSEIGAGKATDGCISAVNR